MIQILILLCAIALCPDPAQSRAEKEVLSAMNAWKQAMIDRDRTALEALYAPSLIYTHSNGRQENKTEAIENVVNAKDRFESIDLTDISITIYGSTAIVKAKTAMRMNSGGTLNLDVLQVWIKLSGRWQLVARQAIRVNS